MTELLQFRKNLIDAIEAIDTFTDTKKTKAQSARIRKVLGEVKNQVTGVRAALVAADKAGY